MKQDYRHTKTTISGINYHFVWCTRRRRKVLVDRLEARLKALLIEACQRIDCRILALETMPDHIHLFLNAPPTLAPDQIMHRLKGYTSRMLRQEFEVLQRMPSTWTRSYFVSTAGNVSSQTIERYIAEQKTRG